MTIARISAILAALVLPFTIDVRPVAASLTHAWAADGNANDAVGDDDGSIVGGTSYGPGLFGQGFVFDGMDDSVAFGNTAGNFGASDFTIALVIRTTSSGIIEGVLGKREICAFSSFWDLRTSNGRLSLEVYETSTNTGVSTTVPINDGLFHTVVFTRAGTVLSSYVDGFFNAEYDAGFTANVSNNAALVAGTSTCTGKDGTVPFTGTIDEIRLADSAEPGLLPAFFHCGDANLNGQISAADALSALRTAVGLEPCGLCLCDANDSGNVSAGDAQTILRFAVGQPVPLLCPLCPIQLPM